MILATKPIRKGILAVSFLLTATPGIAADVDGRYAVEGPGAQQCSAFVALSPTSQEYAITAGYISGYLGASNALSPDAYDLTPWQTLELSLLHIQQFCKSNPDATLATGLAQYTAFLLPNRISEREDKTSLQVDDAIIVQYQSVVERIRKVLSDKGFGSETEPLDGLKDFQLSIGVKPTGLPDQVTLSQLFSAAQ